MKVEERRRWNIDQAVKKKKKDHRISLKALRHLTSGRVLRINLSERTP